MDDFVVQCSASPQITDAGSLLVKLQRSVMRHVCCRETPMYWERVLPGGNHLCLLTFFKSNFLFKMMDTVSEKEVALLFIV